MESKIRESHGRLSLTMRMIGYRLVWVANVICTLRLVRSVAILVLTIYFCLCHVHSESCSDKLFDDYTYAITAKELPTWGMTGESNEEITRHIMCCHGAPHIATLTGIDSSDNEATPDASISNNDDVTARPLVTMPEPHQALTQLEIQVLDMHHPAWFSSDSSEWKGTTHDDAKAFCESIPHSGNSASGNDGGTYHLCPISAYCPNGPNQETEPLYLQMEAFDGVQWAPFSNNDTGWVMVGKFSDQTPLTCQTYLQINHHGPEWGVDGTSPELKQNILCCEDKSGYDGGVMKADEEDGTITSPAENLDGSNNADGTVSQPGDIGSTSGVANAASSNIGTNNNEDSTSSMTEWEMQIQDVHHPAWFSKEFGWKGTTYNDAKAFCESIPHGDDDGTLHLCPLAAYCPNGPRNTEPLYLQMDAYEGVQWAPISSGDNEWVMVGDIGDLTCQTYAQVNHREPAWGLDGSSAQLKEHLLCCEGNIEENGATKDDEEASTAPGDGLSDMVVDIQQGADNSVTSASTAGSDGDSVQNTSQQAGDHDFENSITNTFNPMWFDTDVGGWDGGSHDDAAQFCEQFAGSHGKRMELCPYAAYCPQGPSQPTIGGHDANFDEEGEQWAPVFGKSNHWVMVGRKGTNSATTCLSHVQLNGQEPSWGLDGSNKEMKKHVMCCSPLQ